MEFAGCFDGQLTFLSVPKLHKVHVFRVYRPKV